MATAGSKLHVKLFVKRPLSVSAAVCERSHVGIRVRAHVHTPRCIIAEPRGIRIVSINQPADRICSVGRGGGGGWGGGEERKRRKKK